MSQYHKRTVNFMSKRKLWNPSPFQPRRLYEDGTSDYYCRLCKTSFDTSRRFGGHFVKCRKVNSKRTTAKVNLVEPSLPFTKVETQEFFFLCIYRYILTSM